MEEYVEDEEQEGGEEEEEGCEEDNSGVSGGRQVGRHWRSWHW